MSSGRVNIWLGRDLKKALKETDIQLSKFLREKLIEEFIKRNITIGTWKDDMQDLILKVMCPFCQFKQNTTSIKSVTCFSCGRRYEVYTKTKTRIVELVKGNRAMLLQRRYFMDKSLPKLGET